jgi:hypothetical protein
VAGSRKLGGCSPRAAAPWRTAKTPAFLPRMSLHRGDCRRPRRTSGWDVDWSVGRTRTKPSASTSSPDAASQGAALAAVAQSVSSSASSEPPARRTDLALTSTTGWPRCVWTSARAEDALQAAPDRGGISRQDFRARGDEVQLGALAAAPGLLERALQRGLRVPESAPRRPLPLRPPRSASGWGSQRPLHDAIASGAESCGSA